MYFSFSSIKNFWQRKYLDFNFELYCSLHVYKQAQYFNTSDYEAVEIKTQNPQRFGSLFVCLSTKDQWSW